MFNKVSQCLANRATISIGDRAVADGLRDRDNAARIGDNFAEIGNNATVISDIAARVIQC